MTNFTMPVVYPITDAQISGLSHTAQVEKLIAGGAKLIQLREKYLSPQEFYDDAREALKIAHANDVKILINDRVDLARVLKADGVHLGQTDLPPDEARKILGATAIIGFSTHNVEQVREALKMPIDYIAFGPVFNTTTKENPDAVVGLETLKRIGEIIKNHDETKFPLIAIGGITGENAVEVLKAGADSVAIISDLLREPHKITDKMLEAVSKILCF
ncbi:MAG: thiamine phosphate synthase [Pyrinomonadaceae bacterium]|nr:thiamine phosphate synthase [Pyrinomonadaceae bacterium]